MIAAIYARTMIVLGLLSLTGCVVSLSPGGERVWVVRNPKHVKECTLLGHIEAASYTQGPGVGVGLDKNKRELQNETAKMGGDTLLILQERASFLAPRTYAEAYNCGRAAPASR